jgi:pyridoxine 5-phosphate synthase
MAHLGVNIDHLATLRRVRNGKEPVPEEAALICLKAGADSIVAHLREDRRHIRDQDVFAIRKAVKGVFNLEMSIAADIVNIAIRVKPDLATLVPERRKEVTTEGGLNVTGQYKKISKAVSLLEHAGITVSLFIDPDPKQIEAAAKMGVRRIELHTGRFASSNTGISRKRSLRELAAAARLADALGMHVAAGHGLDYDNVVPVAGIPEIAELNIGYSIVCRAALSGLAQAVRRMKGLIR